MTATINMFLLRSFFVLGFILFFFSCAKETPFKPVFKDKEVIEKSLISDINSSGKTVTYNKIIDGDNSESPVLKGFEETIADNVYLYIPTVESGSYYSSEVMPYHVGQEKLVQFEFTKTALKVYGHEKDKRFQGEGSRKPILEIPAVHKDFKCRENSNNECSNEEEENNDIAWENKKYVELNFDKVKVTEFDSSAGFYQELINQLFKCNVTESARVKSWSITKDSVDIIVERTMKTSLMCMNLRTADLEDQSYKIDHHYQFKKLNALASHDYQPALYMKSDEDAFGFFKSGLTKLSADNQQLYYSEQVFMNRFNPKKKIITYHLSENHFQGEFSSILEATKKSIAIVNKGLEKAGTQVKIELSTTSREDNIHNIQNSIIMVKEPFKAGPLGYGPSIKNPINGEILQAQTVMYYGNMLWTIRSAYNDLIRTKVASTTVETKAGPVKSAEQAAQEAEVVDEILTAGQVKTFKDFVRIEKPVDYFENEYLDDFSHAYDQFRSESFSDSVAGKMTSRSERFKYDMNSLKEREDIFSRHNIFSADHLNIEKMLKQIMTTPELNATGLVPWRSLSDNQKQVIIDLLLPKLWGPVLIHELGHNLGLRHNFEGSEDSANFYTKEELAAIGVDHKVPYSSVMDYTHSDINALPVLGKYDVAALQFGYARKLNNKDGTKQPVEFTLQILSDAKKKELVEYGYCSDDAVALNATCNRFDEGTSASEIAQFYVDTYKKNLGRMNTKQDRLKFSSYDNYNHYRRKYSRTFYSLRKFFDTYERIYYEYIVNDPSVKEIPFVKDLEKAVTIAADFLVGVLRTEDAQCSFKDLQTKEEIWVSLKAMNYSTCGSIPVGNRYELLGQTGQLLLDAKTRENTSSYVDQIDVRGFWMDKVLALETLSIRQHGVTPLDKYTENFMTMGVKLSNGQTVDAAIKDYLNELIDGKFNREVTMTHPNGKEVKVVRLVDSAKEHFIPDSVSGYFNKKMGLGRSQTHLSEILLETIIDHNGAFDNTRKNNLTKDYLVYNDDFSHLDQPILVQTRYGNFYYENDNKLVPAILGKIELAELMGNEKDSEIIAAIAMRSLTVKDADTLLFEVPLLIRTQAIKIYNSGMKPVFDFLAQVPQKEIKAYIAGDFDNVSEQVKGILDRVNLEAELLKAASKIKDEEKTGEMIAINYHLSKVPNAKVYKKIIEKIVKVEDISVIKSLATQTLNTKEHYEKIISALSQVNKKNIE